MTRKKTDGRKSQEYDLGDGVSIAIYYPEGAKPPMLHEDDTCVVSLDRDKFAAAVRGLRYDSEDPNAGQSVRQVAHAGPSRVMSPEDRAAALERLDGQQTGVTKPKPMTSEDLFRQAGVDTNILATIERAAEG